MRRRIRVTAPDAKYSLLSDGAIVPAFGVLGGRSGKPLASWVEESDNSTVEFDTPGKVSGHLVYERARVVLLSAGGGGYGDPRDRPAAKVAEDFRLGYISDRAMREVYGVVVSDESGTVDEASTEALRTTIHSTRLRLAAVPEECSYRSGKVSRHRICRLHPSDAQEIGAQPEDLVELDTGQCAPLRAWLVLDSMVEAQSCPIDAHGQAMLGVSIGNSIEVRLLGIRPT